MTREEAVEEFLAMKSYTSYKNASQFWDSWLEEQEASK